MIHHISDFLKQLLDNLRVYGCLCYVSSLKHNSTKLSSQAKPCVFVGYPVHQKAYKVLNLSTSEILVYRDVTFYERHFPYHMLSGKSKSQYLSSIFLPTTTNIVHSSLFENDDLHSSPSSLSTDYDTLHTQPNPTLDLNTVETLSNNISDNCSSLFTGLARCDNCSSNGIRTLHITST